MQEFTTSYDDDGRCVRTLIENDGNAYRGTIWMPLTLPSGNPLPGADDDGWTKLGTTEDNDVEVVRKRMSSCAHELLARHELWRRSPRPAVRAATGR